MKKRVLTNHTTYNHLRNFLEVPVKNYEYRKVHDIYKVPTHLLFKLFRKTNYRFLNSYNDFDLYSADLYHFFNSISFGKKPWVVTYEWTLPIWGPRHTTNYEKAGRYLAGEYCKKTIAMSDWANRCQIANIMEYYPSFSEEVLRKNCIIHPQQKLNINGYDDKHLDANFIHFTIIGHDFFRKGGKEILSAFAMLIDKKYPVKLHIISKMQYGDPLSRTTSADYQNAMKFIRKSENHIFHYKLLSNNDVLDILRKTDVALLPTYHDTYGYSVLEAQSCGCGVISTDIYALPEINNNEVGWLINVPKDNESGVKIGSKQERIHLSEMLVESLLTIIRNLVENRQVIKEKGMLAMDRIKKEHDPDDVASKLEEIYADATLR